MKMFSPRSKNAFTKSLSNDKTITIVTALQDLCNHKIHDFISFMISMKIYKIHGISKYYYFCDPGARVALQIVKIL